MSLDPNRKFMYIVDGKGMMRELEVINGKVDDKEDLLFWADSQVSTGWLSAAYRFLKDDMLNDDVVVVDPEPPSTSSSSLEFDSLPTFSETCPGLSVNRERSRSRTRTTSSPEKSENSKGVQTKD